MRDRLCTLSGRSNLKYCLRSREGARGWPEGSGLGPKRGTGTVRPQPDHHFGVRLDSLLSIGGPDLQGGGGSLIEDIASPAEMSFFPPPSDDAESRLSINLYHASFQPVGLAGWGVLVSQPAAELHQQFMPTAYLIIGMCCTLVMFLFLTVKQFTQRISEPFRAAAGAARQITNGNPPRVGALKALADSELTEVMDLSDSLGRMEEALVQKDHRNQERQDDLQQQLLQAQKMEAIGRLAGGVAHDFNNTLTPILAYAEIGLQTIEDKEARDCFEQISEAASRAKDVTMQLLAFGRKQVLAISVP